MTAAASGGPLGPPQARHGGPHAAAVDSAVRGLQALAAAATGTDGEALGAMGCALAVVEAALEALCVAAKVMPDPGSAALPDGTWDEGNGGDGNGSAPAECEGMAALAQVTAGALAGPTRLWAAATVLLQGLVQSMDLPSAAAGGLGGRQGGGPAAVLRGVLAALATAVGAAQAVRQWVLRTGDEEDDCSASANDDRAEALQVAVQALAAMDAALPADAAALWQHCQTLQAAKRHETLQAALLDTFAAVMAVPAASTTVAPAPSGPVPSGVDAAAALEHLLSVADKSTTGSGVRGAALRCVGALCCAVPSRVVHHHGRIGALFAAVMGALTAKAALDAGTGAGLLAGISDFFTAYGPSEIATGTGLTLYQFLKACMGLALQPTTHRYDLPMAALGLLKRHGPAFHTDMAADVTGLLRLLRGLCGHRNVGLHRQAYAAAAASLSGVAASIRSAAHQSQGGAATKEARRELTAACAEMLASDDKYVLSLGMLLAGLLPHAWPEAGVGQVGEGNDAHHTNVSLATVLFDRVTGRMQSGAMMRGDEAAVAEAVRHLPQYLSSLAHFLLLPVAAWAPTAREAALQAVRWVVTVYPKAYYFRGLRVHTQRAVLELCTAAWACPVLQTQLLDVIGRVGVAHTIASSDLYGGNDSEEALPTGGDLSACGALYAEYSPFWHGLIREPTTSMTRRHTTGPTRAMTGAIFVDRFPWTAPRSGLAALPPLADVAAAIQSAVWATVTAFTASADLDCRVVAGEASGTVQFGAADGQAAGPLLSQGAALVHQGTPPDSGAPRRGLSVACCDADHVRLAVAEDGAVVASNPRDVTLFLHLVEWLSASPWLLPSDRKTVAAWAALLLRRSATFPHVPGLYRMLSDVVSRWRCGAVPDPTAADPNFNEGGPTHDSAHGSLADALAHHARRTADGLHHLSRELLRQAVRFLLAVPVPRDGQCAVACACVRALMSPTASVLDVESALWLVAAAGHWASPLETPDVARAVLLPLFTGCVPRVAALLSHADAQPYARRCQHALVTVSRIVAQGGALTPQKEELVGQEATGGAIRTDSTVDVWADCSGDPAARVIAFPLPSFTLDLRLDLLLPLVARKASDPQRQVRVAAAELLHASALIVVGRSRGDPDAYAPLLGRLLPEVVALVGSQDALVEALFRALLWQLARWSLWAPPAVARVVVQAVADAACRGGGGRTHREGVAVAAEIFRRCAADTAPAPAREVKQVLLRALYTPLLQATDPRERSACLRAWQCLWPHVEHAWETGGALSETSTSTSGVVNVAACAGFLRAVLNKAPQDDDGRALTADLARLAADTLAAWHHREQQAHEAHGIDRPATTGALPVRGAIEEAVLWLCEHVSAARCPSVQRAALAALALFGLCLAPSGSNTRDADEAVSLWIQHHLVASGGARAAAVDVPLETTRAVVEVLIRPVSIDPTNSDVQSKNTATDDALIVLCRRTGADMDMLLWLTQLRALRSLQPEHLPTFVAPTVFLRLWVACASLRRAVPEAGSDFGFLQPLPAGAGPLMFRLLAAAAGTLVAAVGAGIGLGDAQGDGSKASPRPPQRCVLLSAPLLALSVEMVLTPTDISAALEADPAQIQAVGREVITSGLTVPAAAAILRVAVAQVVARWCSSSAALAGLLSADGGQATHFCQGCLFGAQHRLLQPADATTILRSAAGVWESRRVACAAGTSMMSDAEHHLRLLFEAACEAGDGSAAFCTELLDVVLAGGPRPALWSAPMDGASVGGLPDTLPPDGPQPSGPQLTSTGSMMPTGSGAVSVPAVLPFGAWLLMAAKAVLADYALRNASTVVQYAHRHALPLAPARDTGSSQRFSSPAPPSVSMYSVLFEAMAQRLAASDATVHGALAVRAQNTLLHPWATAAHSVGALLLGGSVQGSPPTAPQTKSTQDTTAGCDYAALSFVLRVGAMLVSAGPQQAVQTAGPALQSLLDLLCLSPTTPTSPPRQWWGPTGTLLLNSAAIGVLEHLPAFLHSCAGHVAPLSLSLGALSSQLLRHVLVEELPVSAAELDPTSAQHDHLERVLAWLAELLVGLAADGPACADAVRAAFPAIRLDATRFQSTLRQLTATAPPAGLRALVTAGMDILCARNMPDDARVAASDALVLAGLRQLDAPAAVAVLEGLIGSLVAACDEDQSTDLLRRTASFRIIDRAYALLPVAAMKAEVTRAFLVQSGSLPSSAPATSVKGTELTARLITITQRVLAGPSTAAPEPLHVQPSALALRQAAFGCLVSVITATQSKESQFERLFTDPASGLSQLERLVDVSAAAGVRLTVHSSHRRKTVVGALWADSAPNPVALSARRAAYSQAISGTVSALARDMTASQHYLRGASIGKAFDTSAPAPAPHPTGSMARGPSPPPFSQTPHAAQPDDRRSIPVTQQWRLREAAVDMGDLAALRRRKRAIEQRSSQQSAAALGSQGTSASGTFGTGTPLHLTPAQPHGQTHRHGPPSPAPRGPHLPAHEGGHSLHNGPVTMPPAPSVDAVLLDVDGLWAVGPSAAFARLLEHVIAAFPEGGWAQHVVRLVRPGAPLLPQLWAAKFVTAYAAYFVRGDITTRRRTTRFAVAVFPAVTAALLRPDTGRGVHYLLRDWLHAVLDPEEDALREAALYAERPCPLLRALVAASPPERAGIVEACTAVAALLVRAAPDALNDVAADNQRLFRQLLQCAHEASARIQVSRADIASWLAYDAAAIAQSSHPPKAHSLSAAANGDDNDGLAKKTRLGRLCGVQLCASLVATDHVLFEALPADAATGLDEGQFFRLLLANVHASGRGGQWHAVNDTASEVVGIALKQRAPLYGGQCALLGQTTTLLQSLLAAGQANTRSMTPSDRSPFLAAAQRIAQYCPQVLHSLFQPIDGILRSGGAVPFLRLPPRDIVAALELVAARLAAGPLMPAGPSHHETFADRVLPALLAHFWAADGTGLYLSADGAPLPTALPDGVEAAFLTLLQALAPTLSVGHVALLTQTVVRHGAMRVPGPERDRTAVRFDVGPVPSVATRAALHKLCMALLARLHGEASRDHDSDVPVDGVAESAAAALTTTLLLGISDPDAYVKDAIVSYFHQADDGASAPADETSVLCRFASLHGIDLLAVGNSATGGGRLRSAAVLAAVGSGDAWLQHAAVLLLMTAQRTASFAARDHFNASAVTPTFVQVPVAIDPTRLAGTRAPSLFQPLPPVGQLPRVPASLSGARGPSSAGGGNHRRQGSMSSSISAVGPPTASLAPTTLALSRPPPASGDRSRWEVRSGASHIPGRLATISGGRAVGRLAATFDRTSQPDAVGPSVHTTTGGFYSHVYVDEPSAIGDVAVADAAYSSSGTRRFRPPQQHTMKNLLLFEAGARQARRVAAAVADEAAANFVLLMRDYGSSELPDVQQPPAAVLLPLQVLCLYCPDIAAFVTTTFAAQLVAATSPNGPAQVATARTAATGAHSSSPQYLSLQQLQAHGRLKVLPQQWRDMCRVAVHGAMTATGGQGQPVPRIVHYAFALCHAVLDAADDPNLNPSSCADRDGAPSHRRGTATDNGRSGEDTVPGTALLEALPVLGAAEGLREAWADRARAGEAGRLVYIHAEQQLADRATASAVLGALLVEPAAGRPLCWQVTAAARAGRPMVCKLEPAPRARNASNPDDHDEALLAQTARAQAEAAMREEADRRAAELLLWQEVTDRPGPEGFALCLRAVGAHQERLSDATATTTAAAQLFLKAALRQLPPHRAVSEACNSSLLAALSPVVTTSMTRRGRQADGLLGRFLAMHLPVDAAAQLLESGQCRACRDLCAAAVVGLLARAGDGDESSDGYASVSHTVSVLTQLRDAASVLLLQQGSVSDNTSATTQLMRVHTTAVERDVREIAGAASGAMWPGGASTMLSTGSIGGPSAYSKTLGARAMSAVARRCAGWVSVATSAGDPVLLEDVTIAATAVAKAFEKAQPPDGGDMAAHTVVQRAIAGLAERSVEMLLRQGQVAAAQALWARCAPHAQSVGAGGSPALAAVPGLLDVAAVEEDVRAGRASFAEAAERLRGRVTSAAVAVANRMLLTRLWIAANGTLPLDAGRLVATVADPADNRLRAAATPLDMLDYCGALFDGVVQGRVRIGPDAAAGELGPDLAARVLALFCGALCDALAGTTSLSLRDARLYHRAREHWLLLVHALGILPEAVAAPACDVLRSRVSTVPAAALLPWLPQLVATARRAPHCTATSATGSAFAAVLEHCAAAFPQVVMRLAEDVGGLFNTSTNPPTPNSTNIANIASNNTAAIDVALRSVVLAHQQRLRGPLHFFAAVGAACAWVSFAGRQRAALAHYAARGGDAALRVLHKLLGPEHMPTYAGCASGRAALVALIAALNGALQPLGRDVPLGGGPAAAAIAGTGPQAAEAARGALRLLAEHSGWTAVERVAAQVQQRLGGVTGDSVVRAGLAAVQRWEPERPAEHLLANLLDVSGLQAHRQAQSPDGGEAVAYPLQHAAYLGTHPALVPAIDTADRLALVLASAQRPIRVGLLLSNGTRVFVLLKGGDDLRTDALVQTAAAVLNRRLQAADVSVNSRGRPHLAWRAYSVIPLSPQAGLVEWVPNTRTLKALAGHDNVAAAAADYAVRGVDPYQQLLGRVRQDLLNTDDTHCRASCSSTRQSPPRTVAGEEYQRLSRRPLNSTAFLRRELCALAGSYALHYHRRAAFTASLAAVTALGYLFAVGDRHLENLLVDTATGAIVAIDFGHAFGGGVTLPIVEVVPFRLTPQLRMVLGPQWYPQLLAPLAEVIRAAADPSGAFMLGALAADAPQRIHPHHRGGAGGGVAAGEAEAVRRRLRLQDPCVSLVEALRANPHAAVQSFAPTIAALAHGGPLEHTVSAGGAPNHRTRLGTLAIRPAESATGAPEHGEALPGPEAVAAVLVSLATDPDLLGLMYAGWCPLV